MLREINDVRQDNDPGYRRWFTDDYFDLIVWYDDSDTITGFQLCYDIHESERSLTWVKEKGFSHNKIDAGENPGHSKMTPILVADGAFEKDKIADKFKTESKKMDPELAALIYAKLLSYPIK